jgi:hypothetical protein
MVMVRSSARDVSRRVPVCGVRAPFAWQATPLLVSTTSVKPRERSAFVTFLTHLTRRHDLENPAQGL